MYIALQIVNLSHCPDRCDKCKAMSDVFAKLHDSYFFYPNSHQANNQKEVPCQPILWRIFSSVIDKSNKKFRIETGRSITNLGLVLNHGKTR